MVQFILIQVVIPTEQRADDTEVGQITAGEQQRPLTPGENGQLALQLMMLVTVPADQMGSATANPIAGSRLLKRGQHLRMLGQAEIVVAAEVDTTLAVDVDMDALRAAGLVGPRTKKVKVINTGTLERAVTVKGLNVTKGAQAAIEAAGGKVE